MPVRAVQDVNGRTWHVYVVLEGTKWDKKPRRNWLCLENGNERKYISPVPTGWEEWSDERLRIAIAQAKPDLRG
jgi:hypothetical protein